MNKLKWILCLLAAIAVLAGASAPLRKTAMDKSARGVCAAVRATNAGAFQSAPCADCPKQCESQVQSCKDGSVKACYLAAVCLCQCNLDAGGCGSDKEALRKCVDENRKNARSLE